MNRDEWAAELAETVLDCARKRHRPELMDACDANTLLAAWIVVHIATGHATGVTANEIAVALETWRPGHDWATITVNVISAFRSNGLPPQINEDLALAWDSLLQLVVSSRGYESVRPDLIAYDGAASVVGRHRDEERAPEPDPTPILDAFPRDDLWSAQVQPFRLSAPHLDPHRRAVGALQRHLREDDASGRELAAPYIRGLEAWLTPMEFAALFEASDHRLLLDEALDASKRILVVPYATCDLRVMSPIVVSSVTWGKARTAWSEPVFGSHHFAFLPLPSHSLARWTRDGVVHPGGSLRLVYAVLGSFSRCR